MAQKTIQGSENLAKQIKSRRNELGLTIEEAASRAGVGTKTWCRYETGESIRRDKCKGICKALNWRTFPNQSDEENELLSIQEYRKHEAWSNFLEKKFGTRAAMSFVIGSDILFGYIVDDIASLSSLPAGTHIGQLDVSWLKEKLPQQFLVHYDYEFLHWMKGSLYKIKSELRKESSFIAHSVMEELLIYLCNEEASLLMELNDGIYGSENKELTGSKDWVFDFFEDMDIVSCLYSDTYYLDIDDIYHFSRWKDQQFFI